MSNDTNGDLVDEITPQVEQVARDAGVKHSQIKFVSGTVKGDNYLGKVRAIDVYDGDMDSGDSAKAALHLIVKQSLKGKELREQAPIRSVYEQETHFYETLYPALERFQRERGVDEKDLLNCAPKCYYTNLEEDKEILIFDNLCASGFSMWNRKVPMTRSHVEIVLREYGKLHSISFAMRQHNPQLLKTLTDCFFDMYAKYDDDVAMNEHFKSMLRNQIEQCFDKEREKELCEQLELFVEDVMVTSKELRKATEEQMVISHGDCWCNNMLFKYEAWDKNKITPTNIRLLDYQLIKMASPAIDLSHFIFNNSSKDVFDAMDALLDIYYDSLATHLRRMNCDPDELFSRSDLDRHWRQYNKNGLIITFFMLKIMVSDGEEVPDLAEAVKDGKNIMEAFDFKTKNESTYQKRLRDVVLYFYENNMIL